MTIDEAKMCVLACPKCGKLPKIRITENSVSGSVVTIECKRLLRKPHIRVIQIKASVEHATECAVDNWNRMVNYAKIMGCRQDS